MFQVTKNSKTCEKLILRDIAITKTRQNLKVLDQPISYTTAREHNHLGESDSIFKKQTVELRKSER